MEDENQQAPILLQEWMLPPYEQGTIPLEATTSTISSTETQTKVGTRSTEHGDTTPATATTIPMAEQGNEQGRPKFQDHGGMTYAIMNEAEATDGTENTAGIDVLSQGYDSMDAFAKRPGVGSSEMNLASLTSTSNTSSPLQSGYASSASFGSSYAGLLVTSRASEHMYSYVDKGSHSLDSLTALHLQASTLPISNVPTPRQLPDEKQAYGYQPSHQPVPAPHDQFYPLPYRPKPGNPQAIVLPEQQDLLEQLEHVEYTNMRKSRNRVSMAGTSRTAGNSPAVSPGFFSPRTEAKVASSGSSSKNHYHAAILPTANFHPPKETSKLVKDFDPMSGRKIINSYELLVKLGSGAHGTVKLGKDLHSSDLVAVKIVRRFSKKIRLGKPEDPEDKVRKEVAVLKKARHPHVVSLLEVIDDIAIGKVYLILEYVERGEILWRKPTSKDIIVFEMNRTQREVRGGGQVDAEAEAEQVARFNESLPQRQQEMNRILDEQSRTATKRVADERRQWSFQEDTVIQPLWSLEYPGESDEERRDRSFRQLLRHTELEPLSPTHSEHQRIPAPGSTTPPVRIPSRSLEQLTVLLDQTPHRDGAASAEAAVAAVFDQHKSLQKALKLDKESAIKATLNRIIVQDMPLTDQEEEFRYVPCLTLSRVLDIFRDTVLGLEYLHYQGIIHRDIKPANLLWTWDYRVKISDFGVSYLGRPIREDDNHDEMEEADSANLEEGIELAKTVGTPAFYAPELCDPELFNSRKTTVRPQITGQVDVWALGVTLYGMIFGRLPFFDLNEFGMYEKIARHEVFIPSVRLRGVEYKLRQTEDPDKRDDDYLAYEEVGDDLQDLLRRLLHKHPSKRISLKEVKHHPWVLRGIQDVPSWLEKTDPSFASQGRKIEVSKQDVVEAVAPLTILERMRSGMRNLLRGRESKKRADMGHRRDEAASSVSSRGSGPDRESRRSSLRGDEQILSALKASRETTYEHPLAQSLVPSPESVDHRSGFSFADLPPSRSSLPANLTPRPGTDRTGSTAESIMTVRALPTGHPSFPRLTDDVHQLHQRRNLHNSISSSSSSALAGILGNAGRSIARSIRSRDRLTDPNSGNDSSRASSVEHMTASFEDSHAFPSVALSCAIAAGHVEPPPALRERETPLDGFHARPSHQRYQSSPSEQRASSTHRVGCKLPGESSVDAFHRAGGIHHHSYMQETQDERARPRRRAGTTTSRQSSPALDNATFGAYYSPILPAAVPLPTASNTDDVLLLNISSNEHLTPAGIRSPFSAELTSKFGSESSSQSMSGVGTQFGLLVPAKPVGYAAGVESLMETGETVRRDIKGEDKVLHAALEVDDAGYIGDGDDEDISDEEGLTFGDGGKRKRK